MKDDRELVAAASVGGADAFRPIVDRYQHAVFGVALARLGDFHEAQDVAQQVFVEAFQRLGSLRDPARLGAWLRSMTVHRCIDSLRRRKDAVGIESAENVPSSDLPPDGDLAGRELRDRVMAAIGKLTKTQRETVTLFYINGYSTGDIAAMHEVPVGTIKRRLHDARGRLKEEMLEMVEDTLKAEAPGEDFGRRVFDLLCQHGKPAPLRPWTDIRDELRDVGIKGVDGFVDAMQLPHSPTRLTTVRILETVHNAAASTLRDQKEVLIELLMRALEDKNKKVRTWAATALLNLDADEKRTRKDFIPAVLPLLRDPTRHVRWRVAYELWPWAANVPLEAAAIALAEEVDPGTRCQMAELVRRIIRARERETSETSEPSGHKTRLEG